MLGPELFPKPQSLEVFQQWQIGSPSWQSFMHCLESCTTPTNLALIFIMSWSCSHGHSNISSCMNIWNLHRTDWTFPCTEKCPWLSTDDGDPWSPVDLGSTYGNPCALMLDGKMVPETPFFFGWQDPGITIYIWGLLYIKANNKSYLYYTHTHMKTYMTCFPADFCPNGSAQ